MSAFGMTARAEWLAGLARDYADASDDARDDYEPGCWGTGCTCDIDWDELDDTEDDDASTHRPPAAKAGVHLVRPRTPRGSLHVDGGDEDAAGPVGATGRRDDGLPMCTCDGCWACGGHVNGCTCDVDWDEIYERSRS